MMITSNFAGESYLPDNGTLAVHHTALQMHPVASTEPTQPWIRTKGGFYAPHPIRAWRRIVISDRNDITSGSIQAAIECCNLTGHLAQRNVKRKAAYDFWILQTRQGSLVIRPRYH
jgi:hypothetical protein